MTNTANKTQKLTEKQFNALKAILARGGVDENDGTLHQGNLRKRPGTINRGLALRLWDMGLLKGEHRADPRPGYYPRTILYVSAKGCQAVMEEEGRRTLKALEAEGLDYQYRPGAKRAA